MNIRKFFRFIYLMIKKQEVRRKLNKLNKMKYKNKSSKSISGSSDALDINAETENLIEQTRLDIEEFVKQVQGQPEPLIENVKAAGTPVYRFPNAKKLLQPIKEETGFICEKKGLEALYLSIITEHKFKFYTPPMFVLKTGKLEPYLTVYNFYLWYSQKVGLDGFDYETQKKFKKYYINNSSEETNKLSLKDIYEIEAAISREKEATDFVLKYEKHIEGAKNVLNKIKNDGSANV